MGTPLLDIWGNLLDSYTVESINRILLYNRFITQFDIKD